MPEANWNAGAKLPGVAGAYDSTAIVKSIREARMQADLVIVIAHWGRSALLHLSLIKPSYRTLLLMLELILSLAVIHMCFKGWNNIKVNGLHTAQAILFF